MEEVTATSNIKIAAPNSKKHEKSKNVVSPTEYNDLPETSHKDMEIYYFPNREFKIPVLGKLDELQENTERQFKEIKNTKPIKMRNYEKGRSHKKQSLELKY